MKVKIEGRGKERGDEKCDVGGRKGVGRETELQYGIYRLQSVFHIHDAIGSCK